MKNGIRLFETKLEANSVWQLLLDSSLSRVLAKSAKRRLESNISKHIMKIIRNLFA